MHELSLGLAVSLAVVLVVLVVGGLTAMYCNWIERSDERPQAAGRRANVERKM
jgi:hypothetical protein